jgi:hypothetical protein
MEVIQAFSYPFIDQCGSSGNLLVTKLAFIHIILHPFFFNALALHFVSSAVRRAVSPWVYSACAVSALVMIFQLYPISGGGLCAPHRATCGPDFCTFMGNWHLAWNFPYNSWGNNFLGNSNVLLGFFPNAYVTYTLTVFIMPFFYGAWKITGFQWVIGPVLASQLTDNIHEQPAVWCLLSFWIACIVIFSPLRKLLRQERFILSRFFDWAITSK